MPVQKADYLRGGLQAVTGWLNRSTATYLSALEVLQRGLGIDGDVCEIGVHHGKSFLCLALGLPDHQRAVAIDVFGNQDLNKDRSGRGDREVFEGNLAKHGAGANVDIIEASSLSLDTLGFLEAGRRFRLFSIDGGHTADVTYNDLHVAERTVVSRGVVALDDLLNPHWLGVVTGLFRYWFDGGTLVPFAVVPGKLLLAPDVGEADTYRRLIAGHFDAARTKREVPLGDCQVDVYGEFPWVVPDDRGGTGLLVGSTAAPAKAASLTRVVPVGYVEELERRLARREPRLRLRIARKAWRRVRQLGRPLVRHRATR
jgi:Methyltransferase domain